MKKNTEVRFNGILLSETDTIPYERLVNKSIDNIEDREDLLEMLLCPAFCVDISDDNTENKINITVYHYIEADTDMDDCEQVLLSEFVYNANTFKLESIHAEHNTASTVYIDEKFV